MKFRLSQGNMGCTTKKKRILGRRYDAINVTE